MEERKTDSQPLLVREEEAFQDATERGRQILNPCWEERKMYSKMEGREEDRLSTSTSKRGRCIPRWKGREKDRLNLCKLGGRGVPRWEGREEDRLNFCR